MSRLLLKLRATENAKYEHHNKYVQGLIYDRIFDTEFDYLHDRIDYKFFCFSPILPQIDTRKGDLRTLVISSPNQGFIKCLNDQFLDNRKEIQIGKYMRFKLEYAKVKETKIPHDKQFSLITVTPVILKIQPYVYNDMMGTDHKRFVYWTTEEPIELFIPQLESNIIKKYNKFYHKHQDTEIIFFQHEQPYDETVILYMHGKPYVFEGTKWEFLFREYNKLLEFVVDCGIGEHNALGFGFVNLEVSN